MSNEYHKPFLKSLIVVAFATLIAMISSKYIIEIYASSNQIKNVEYSSKSKSPE